VPEPPAKIMPLYFVLFITSIPRLIAHRDTYHYESVATTHDYPNTNARFYAIPTRKFLAVSSLIRDQSSMHRSHNVYRGRTIGDIGYQLLMRLMCTLWQHVIKQATNRFYDIDILLFVMPTDIIRFAEFAFFQHYMQGASVILDV